MTETMTPIGVAPSKADVASFVHDVAEIETAIFTLDKTVAEIKRKREEGRAKAQQKVQECETQRETALKELNSARYDQKAANSGFQISGFGWDEMKMIFFSIPIGIGIGIALYIVVAFAMSLAIDIENVNFGRLALVFTFIVGPITGLIGGIIYTIVDCSNISSISSENKRKTAREVEKQEKEHQKAVQLYEASQNALSTYNAADAAVGRTLTAIASRRKILQDRLRSMYALNIIPPDYRTMDCVLIFDQIFRNDLADTMREAVKIYEERVFRGEVIQGIQKIYDMLGTLNSHMAQIGRTLESVRDHVSFMSEDICKLADRAATITSNQERILEESQMNRYAIEEVKKSNERLEYYVRRWS